MSFLSSALCLVILTRQLLRNLSDAGCEAIKKKNHKVFGSFSPFLEFLYLHRSKLEIIQ